MKLKDVQTILRYKDYYKDKVDFEVINPSFSRKYIVCSWFMNGKQYGRYDLHLQSYLKDPNLNYRSIFEFKETF